MKRILMTGIIIVIIILSCVTLAYASLNDMSLQDTVKSILRYDFNNVRDIPDIDSDSKAEGLASIVKGSKEEAKCAVLYEKNDDSYRLYGYINGGGTDFWSLALPESGYCLAGAVKKNETEQKDFADRPSENNSKGIGPMPEFTEEEAAAARASWRNTIVPLLQRTLLTIDYDPQDGMRKSYKPGRERYFCRKHYCFQDKLPYRVPFR